MNSMKTYLTVWFAGVVACLIMMERWRRAGDRSVVPIESAGNAVETAPATMASTAPPTRPKLSTALVVGAKADADRVRKVLTQVPPWSVSAPSFARFRRVDPRRAGGELPTTPG